MAEQRSNRREDLRQDLRWFAARTRCGAELSVAGRLEKLGVESYVPSELRRLTRGGGSYERALIPSLVFLKATKQRACELANRDAVPDKQMDDFRRVLDLSTDEGGLMERPLSLGARVRVIKGVLAGVEGRVLELRGRYYVVVELFDSWFAKASVPRAWLETM